jgi:LysR family transcriptional activator of nhaA
MKSINYNHLYYFWMVAREGSVVRAAEELMLSQPTVSSQIKDFEKSIGHALFDRVGRGLALTDAGRITFNYANEIFSLAQELINALEDRPAGRAQKLAIGILDVIPKPVVQRLLEPLQRLSPPVRLICREDKADRLLADLAARRTDVVLSDSPISTAVHAQGFNHLLGECGTSFFASKSLANRYRAGFPKSLNGAPLLLPTDHTAVRGALNLWFERRRIHPLVVAEFDDSATMRVFGQSGLGIFPVPSLIDEQLQRDREIKLVGRTQDVRARFYAISLDARPKHPAVTAICQAARGVL